MPKTYANVLLDLLPRWLATGTARSIFFSIGEQLDYLRDRLILGVSLRFPGRVDGLGELPTHSIERKLRIGPEEPDRHFAARILNFRDQHRVRGGPYALLNQLHAFFESRTPNGFEMILVYANGDYFKKLADGIITKHHSDTIPSPDRDTAHWARWWLGLYSDSVLDDDLEQPVAYDWNAAHCDGSVYRIADYGLIFDFPEMVWFGEGAIWPGDADIRQIYAFSG